AGPQVRDDRERLQRRLRQPALRRLLDHARAGVRGLARRAERPAAGDVLEDDAAPTFAVALAHQTQRRLDPLRVVLGRLGQLLHRQRRRGDDEERLHRAGELVERVAGNQAERSVHESSLSTSVREILIGANGAAWSIAISPARRSSRRARNATACSIRDSSPTSWSKSNRTRRRRTDRNRSRNKVTAGKRSAMCESETSGGGVARSRSAPASRSGSCGASCGSTFGASGAGPSRKNRSPSCWRRSRSHAAASFMRRYSANRRASSSAAASGSRSASSAASSGNNPRAFSSSSAEMSTRNSPHASRSSSSRS